MALQSLYELSECRPRPSPLEPTSESSPAGAQIVHDGVQLGESDYAPEQRHLNVLNFKHLCSVGNGEDGSEDEGLQLCEDNDEVVDLLTYCLSCAGRIDELLEEK